MTPTLHAAHCYEAGRLVCGWPEFHRCAEDDCQRTVREGWACCDDHAARLVERWQRITAPEPVGDMPRWAPGTSAA